MTNKELTSFGEFAQILDELPVVLRGVRRSRGLSLREAARQIDVSFSTVDRVEKGEDCDTGTLRLILRWLDAVPATEEEKP